MDGPDPYSKKPVNNHPNAVNSVPEKPPEEPETPLPRAKTEPVGPNYYKTNSKKGRWFTVILILLLLAAAAYFLLLKPKPAKAPTKISNSGTSQSASNSVPSDTAHYDSSNFNLGFDYPKGWQVSDTAGSGKLTVTSPDTQLKGADGQTVTGQTVMTIRDKTQKLSEFDKGSATAVLDSEKIAYTKPTQTQRGSTYISFLQYASTTTMGGLDGIYITGDAGYQKGQTIPLVDISKEDPVIDVTFVKDNKQLTIDAGSWNDSSFSKPLKTMLQSFSIQ